MRIKVSFVIEGEGLNDAPFQSVIETAVEALDGVYFTGEYRIEEEGE